MERSALQSLAGFLDRLSNSDFRAGEWVSPKSDHDDVIQMPYVHFSEVVEEFVKAAYDDLWLDTKFDWPKWAGSLEAARLVRDPHALSTAKPEDLSRLLTVCIRRDKFSEGSLLGDFESGLILRIVQRAAAILGESKWAPPLTKLSNQQAGGLGELLALAKLNSLGFAAYMSPEGAPGHDLIAIVDGQAKSIEVKTRQFLHKPSEITRWPVDLGSKGDADFFLFVELNVDTISPTFYLLTNEQARKTNKSFGKGQGNCYPAQVRLIAKRNDFSALATLSAAP
jgi:hypothetical protein